ncbi:hypothetical protein [Cochleicola gelatinilyticus]|nr:hypothetical protein [Cochleicola gelatinilyticus]
MKNYVLAGLLMVLFLASCVPEAIEETTGFVQLEPVDNEGSGTTPPPED